MSTGSGARRGWSEYDKGRRAPFFSGGFPAGPKQKGRGPAREDSLLAASHAEKRIPLTAWKTHLFFAPLSRRALGSCYLAISLRSGQDPATKLEDKGETMGVVCFRSQTPETGTLHTLAPTRSEGASRSEAAQSPTEPAVLTEAAEDSRYGEEKREPMSLFAGRQI